MKSYLVYITEVCGALEFPAETIIRCSESELKAKLDIIRQHWRPYADTVQHVWAKEIPDEAFDFLKNGEYILDFDFEVEEPEEDEEDETY